MARTPCRDGRRRRQLNDPVPMGIVGRPLGPPMTRAIFSGDTMVQVGQTSLHGPRETGYPHTVQVKAAPVRARDVRPDKLRGHRPTVGGVIDLTGMASHHLLRTTHPKTPQSRALPESVHKGFSLGRDRAGIPSAAPPFGSAAAAADHVPEQYGELQGSAYSLSGTAADGTSKEYAPLDGENATTPHHGRRGGKQGCSSLSQRLS